VNRAVAILCLFAGAIFAALGLLLLATKLTSLNDVRALLVIAAFGLAAFGCFRAASRLWRTPVANADRSNNS
jgi:hypothetical protein